MWADVTTNPQISMAYQSKSLLLTDTAADRQLSFPRVTQEFKSFLLAPSTLQDLPKVFFFLNSLHPASQGEERNSLEDNAPDI